MYLEINRGHSHIIKNTLECEDLTMHFKNKTRTFTHTWEHILTWEFYYVSLTNGNSNTG